MESEAHEKTAVLKRGQRYIGKQKHIRDNLCARCIIRLILRKRVMTAVLVERRGGLGTPPLDALILYHKPTDL